MMWNTKYGHLAMMGGPYLYGAAQKMALTKDKAKNIVDSFVKVSFPNASLDKEIETFYGFYEFVIAIDGKPHSYLQVNGYTGQTWYWNPQGAIIKIKKM